MTRPLALKGPATSDDMILGQAGMVRRLVKQARPFRSERDDLVGEGNLALCDAATRFDPKRGLKFSTFAGHRITGAIKDYRRHADGLTPCARNHHDRPKRNRLPDSDIWTAHDVPDPSQAADARDEAALLWSVVATLPRRERLIIETYYRDGLFERQIAPKLACGAARVWQIRRLALWRLRCRLLARGMEGNANGKGKTGGQPVVRCEGGPLDGQELAFERPPPYYAVVFHMGKRSEEQHWYHLEVDPPRFVYDERFPLLASKGA